MKDITASPDPSAEAFRPRPTIGSHQLPRHRVKSQFWTDLYRSRGRHTSAQASSFRNRDQAGFVQELRITLFSSCTLISTFWLHPALTPSTRVQSFLVGHSHLRAHFLESKAYPQYELIDVSRFAGSQLALHFAKYHEYTIVFFSFLAVILLVKVCIHPALSIPACC